MILLNLSSGITIPIERFPALGTMIYYTKIYHENKSDSDLIKPHQLIT